MKAIVIDKFGDADNLHLTDLPDPQPKQGEVRIQVKSAGVGIWDEMYIQGEIPPDQVKFPLVPGWDGAGIISALGAGVTQFQVGDEVIYYDFPSSDNLEGAWAESVAVPIHCVAKKPKSLTWEQAGGLPIISLTAYQALHEGLQMKAGQSLLITNGAGGVGTCAIQLAKIMGIKTIALASEPNHQFLRSLGADEAFDYHKDFSPELRKLFPDGADCIFDDIGKKETVAKALPCLKSGGRFLTIVERFKELERKDVENKFFEVHPSGEQLAEIGRYVDEGKLKIVVDDVYPLEKARDALSRVESGHVHGKVVLKVA